MKLATIAELKLNEKSNYSKKGSELSSWNSNNLIIVIISSIYHLWLLKILIGSAIPELSYFFSKEMIDLALVRFDEQTYSKLVWAVWTKDDVAWCIVCILSYLTFICSELNKLNLISNSINLNDDKSLELVPLVYWMLVIGILTFFLRFITEPIAIWIIEFLTAKFNNIPELLYLPKTLLFVIALLISRSFSYVSIYEYRIPIVYRLQQDV